MKKLLLPFILTVLLFASCIKDDLDGCGLTIGFDYSWNMQNTNGFASQVDEIALFIFDAQGQFVKKFYDQGEHIKKNNYSISFNDIAKGTYQVVVWAQSNTYPDETSYFDWSKFDKSEPSLSDMEVFLRVNRANSVFNSNLNNLLVGYVSPVVITSVKSGHLTIPTKKINNNIRVLIVDSNDDKITTNDFSVRLEHADGNDRIDHNYLTLPSENFTYTPYYYGDDISFTQEEIDANGGVEPKAVAADFAFSKLEKDHNIMLIIEDKEGETVFKKSLINLISLLKDEGHIPPEMDLQEYLDREDQYTVKVLLAVDNSTWITTSIFINGWRVNLIDIEL